MAIKSRIHSNNKKKYFSNFFLSLLFILTFFLVLFNKTEHLILQKIKILGLDIINPITQVVSFPAKIMNDVTIRVNNIQKLESENLRLKEEIIRLKKWQTLAIKNSRENKVYKRILNSTTNDLKIVKTASVINKVGNIYSKIITINAGLNYNVEKNLAVINEKGLVGKVILSSKKNSKVLLISDQNSSIPVKTLSDKSYSILSGTSDGKYLVSSFNKEMKMPKVGELLVTSGNARVFPADILVAKVIKVNKDHYFAIPYVDFKNLSYVQVIKSN